MGKHNMATKLEKHGSMKPKQDFLAAAVRKFYINLLNAKRNDPGLEKELKFATRCYESVLSNDLSEGDQPPKKRFCANGAGKKNQSIRSQRNYD